MKKLFVLLLVLAVAAPVLFAKERPNAYAEIKFYFTIPPTNYPDGSGMTDAKRTSGSIPALVLNSDGMILVKKESYDAMKNYHKRILENKEQEKLSEISQNFTLLLPALGTEYRITGEKFTDIGAGFYVFQAKFQYETKQKAGNLNYPKILENNDDIKEFKKIFNCDANCMAALTAELQNYDKNLADNLRTVEEVKDFPNAYTKIVYDGRIEIPALMIDHNGTFLFRKEAYDSLLKKNLGKVPDFIKINLDMLGTYYKISETDTLQTNGKYYLLKANFQESTQMNAKKTVSIPHIFSDADAQNAFKAKFGQKPDAELDKFLKTNLSPDAYENLGVTKEENYDISSKIAGVKKPGTTDKYTKHLSHLPRK